MTSAKRLGLGDAFISEAEARGLGGPSTGWVRWWRNNKPRLK